jgi:hypothetical protein
MKITKFIDRNYRSASVLEDPKQLAKWLKESPYIVLMDENMSVAGVINSKDLFEHEG